MATALMASGFPPLAPHGAKADAVNRVATEAFAATEKVQSRGGGEERRNPVGKPAVASRSVATTFMASDLSPVQHRTHIPNVWALSADFERGEGVMR